MASAMRGSFAFGNQLAVGLLAVGALALGLGAGGIRVSRADLKSQSTDTAVAHQVTVFAILATPGSKVVDAKLSTIKSQLETLMPRHGFKLLDVQNKQLVLGESVVSDLRNGYTAHVSLVGPVDENGKIPMRYELFLNDGREVSRLVKTPLNQLFFCERDLADGSRLLIGVGVR